MSALFHCLAAFSDEVSMDEEAIVALISKIKENPIGFKELRAELVEKLADPTTDWVRILDSYEENGYAINFGEGNDEAREFVVTRLWKVLCLDEPPPC